MSNRSHKAPVGDDPARCIIIAGCQVHYAATIGDDTDFNLPNYVFDFRRFKTRA